MSLVPLPASPPTRISADVVAGSPAGHASPVAGAAAAVVQETVVAAAALSASSNQNATRSGRASSETPLPALSPQSVGNNAGGDGGTAMQPRDATRARRRGSYGTTPSVLSRPVSAVHARATSPAIPGGALSLAATMTATTTESVDLGTLPRERSLTDVRFVPRENSSGVGFGAQGGLLSSFSAATPGGLSSSLPSSGDRVARWVRTMTMEPLSSATPSASATHSPASTATTTLPSGVGIPHLLTQQAGGNTSSALQSPRGGATHSAALGLASAVAAAPGGGMAAATGTSARGRASPLTDHTGRTGTPPPVLRLGVNATGVSGTGFVSGVLSAGSFVGQGASPSQTASTAAGGCGVAPAAVGLLGVSSAGLVAPLSASLSGCGSASTTFSASAGYFPQSPTETHPPQTTAPLVASPSGNAGFAPQQHSPPTTAGAATPNCLSFSAHRPLRASPVGTMAPAPLAASPLAQAASPYDAAEVTATKGRGPKMARAGAAASAAAASRVSGSSRSIAEVIGNVPGGFPLRSTAEAHDIIRRALALLYNDCVAAQRTPPSSPQVNQRQTRDVNGDTASLNREEREMHGGNDNNGNVAHENHPTPLGNITWPRVVVRVVATRGGPYLAVVLSLFASLAMLPGSTERLAVGGCAGVYAGVMALGTLVEGYVTYTKGVESRARCVAALARHTQNAVTLSYAFAGPFSGLRGVADTPSFHCCYVIRDGVIAIVPKLLLCRGDVVLDRATLEWRAFTSCDGACVLSDVMRLALSRPAVALRPLTNVARPPRLPNRDADEDRDDEEPDDVSSDGSDGEREPRSSDVGNVVPTVPQRMEFFVRRVLLLIWGVTVVVCFLVGIGRTSISEGGAALNLLVLPAVAALGLLPLNSLLFQRIVVVLDSALLSRYLIWLETRGNAAWYDADGTGAPRVAPRDVLSDLRTLLNVHVLFKTMCLARNPVETLGSVTVVAPLDCDGVLTDLVPLPVVVVLVNKSEGNSPGHFVFGGSGGTSASGGTVIVTTTGDEAGPTTNTATNNSNNNNNNNGAGSGDGGGADVSDDGGDNFLCAKSRERTQRRTVRLLLQSKHREFQAQRFAELELHRSLKDDLAVEFVDDRLVEAKSGALNALSMCVLLHSVHSTTTCTAPESAALRAIDSTALWARCMHWLSRACRFDDRLACQYRLIRRVFVATSAPASSSVNLSWSASPAAATSQICGLLFEYDGDLHLFVVGTPDAVLDTCATYWTGHALEELPASERKELLLLARDKWTRARQCQTVGCAHRVLPQRYKAYLLPRDEAEATLPVEDYYLNGRLVWSTGPLPERRAQGASSASSLSSRSRGAPTRGRLGRERETDASGSRVVTASTVEGGVSSGSVAPDPTAATRAPSTIAVALHADRELDGGTGRQRRAASTGSVRGCSKQHFAESTASNVGAGSGGTGTPHDRSSNNNTASAHHRRSRDDHCDAPSDMTMDSDAWLFPATVVMQMLTTDNTFLGLVGLRDQVRPHVEAAVTEMATAGIRFMHFGHGNEQHTKAFGDRIGLETDWNCCIALKSGGAVNLDPFSIRAQLPHGVEAIRRHIMFVDPIPLQVSLFSHARAVNTRSMIAVLQDNHEVVCVLGSPLNHHSVRSFLQGDIALTVIPTNESVATEKANLVNRPGPAGTMFNTDRQSSTWHTFDVVTDLTGSLGALQIPPTANPTAVLVCLIREARRLLKTTNSGVELIIHCNCLLVVVQVLGLIIGLPLPVSPVDSLFLLVFVFPALGAAVLTQFPGRSKTDSMKEVAVKHSHFARVDMMAHSCVVFAYRYVKTALLVLGCAVACLCSAGDVPVSAVLWAAERQVQPAHIDAMRGFTMGALVYLAPFHALTHTSRHRYVVIWRRPHPREYPVWWCHKWAITTLGVWLAHICYLAIERGIRGWAFATFIPVSLLVIIGVWPVVLLVADVRLKLWRFRTFTDRQKLRQLMFGTKLGMHSPRGDYEPDESSEDGSTNTAEGKACPHPWWQQWLFWWTAVQGGTLERNCVCCQWGGVQPKPEPIAAPAAPTTAAVNIAQ